MILGIKTNTFKRCYIDNRIKNNYALYILFLIQTMLWSQNQHEPQNWEKLVGPHVRVLYKANQQQDAFKIANTIEYIQQNNYQSIGYHSTPVDIVLRANTTNANGFVTYSPFRSEFFNTPPPTFNSLGTTDWLSTLAIHEYRHVQQFLNHKNGFTNFLHTLFGESGWAVGSILAIPNWYFEGDAVVMETALTESGRGRLPSFTSLQRALYKNNEIYSYAKIRNGSYKSLVPNQYPTGYQILNYYRNHYDASKLDDIARKAASYHFPFYGFSHYLKKQTGFGTKDLYKISALKNQKRWQKQRDSLQVTNYTHHTTSKQIAFYRFPQSINNEQLIVLKSSLRNIPAFYKIEASGKETKITHAAINNDAYFHYHQNKITYTSISNHPRYNLTDYNDVYLYNIITKKTKRLSHQKRYFSPSFNSTRSEIVVAEINQNKSKIILLNTSNGAIKKEISITGFISRPRFYNLENLIYVKQLNNKVAIFKTHRNHTTETQITPWTSHTIDNIFVDNNFVYYSASFNGIDNIYRSNLTNTSFTMQQITNASIGAYQPSVYNNTLYFTERTDKGTKVASTTINPTSLTYKEPVEMDWNHEKTLAFEKGSILNKIENQQYTTRNYTSVFEDLKFHDWAYTFSDQIISANVTATNLLNDFSLLASSEVYLNENNSFGFSTIASYKKWFPVFNLGIEYTRRDFDASLTTPDNNVLEGVTNFHQLSLTPSVTLPLSQTKGNYFNSLTLNVGYEYEKILDRTFTSNNSTELKLQNPFFGIFKSQLAFSSIRQKAIQHINSRGGFSSISTFEHAVQGIFEGSFFSNNHRLFLPGILQHHNSYLSLAYQRNTVNDGSQFVNLNADTFNYARGFEDIRTKTVHKVSYTYQLPLLYPDFGILGITYFKRIRAHLFADYSRLTLYNNTKTNQNSTGFEIVFDNTFFNISETEIGIGYRGSFLLSKDLLNPNTNYIGSLFISTTLF